MGCGGTNKHSNDVGNTRCNKTMNARFKGGSHQVNNEIHMYVGG